MTPRRAARLLPGWAAVLCSMLAGRANADPRHFRVFEEGLPRGYALSFEASLRHAERSDFSRPIFLIAQEVESIVATELRTSADLEVSIIPWLALEVELPVSLRRADVQLSTVVISDDEVLARKWLDLSGFGVADPELSLAFRLVKTPELGLFARTGVAIPLDDNPGAELVPARLPASTGQTELFLAARGLVTLREVAFELDYRFGFHPGSAATYLTRTVDTGDANGALSFSWDHAFRAGVRLLPERTFSLGIFPEWRLSQSPRLIEGDAEFAFLPESMRHELGLELRLRMRLSKHDALELFYRHVVVDASEQDPFFPIVLPAEGFGIAWQTGGT